MWKCASTNGGLTSRPPASRRSCAGACRPALTALMRPSCTAMEMSLRPSGKLAWVISRSSMGAVSGMAWGLSGFGRGVLPALAGAGPGAAARGGGCGGARAPGGGGGWGEGGGGGGGGGEGGGGGGWGEKGVNEGAPSFLAVRLHQRLRIRRLARHQHQRQDGQQIGQHQIQLVRQPDSAGLLQPQLQRIEKGEQQGAEQGL